MWLAWKRYANFLIFIGIAACNYHKQELQKNLILSDTSFQRYNGKVLVLSEADCIGCSLSKSIYAIHKRIKSSDSIKILIYHTSRNKNNVDIRKIKEFLPKVSSYIFAKNLNIMINLAEITETKSGPYFIEFENGEIKKIESLSRN